MKKIITTSFFFAFHFLLFTANAQIITTVAGSAGTGYAGDWSMATSAELYTPSSVTFDRSGNMFIADTYNNRIRKVNSLGIITTFAGNGIQGFSGDGGPDTAAELNHPTDVAFDKNGNMFIADQNNGRIRKVTTSGGISTFAGTGILGFAGDSGQATAAELYAPAFITFDTVGRLFFSDNMDNVVRQIDTNGIITTIAGINIAGYSGENGPATAAELNSPQGIAYDKSGGTLYIADENNNRIRSISMSSGIIFRLAGNGSFGFSGDKGLAINATLWNPTGLTIDTIGNIYFSDLANNRVRRINASGIIVTIAGNGLVGFSGDGFYGVAARLDAPNGLAVNTGSLYFADQDNNRVRKITNVATINGINEIGYEENNISIYPNPNNGVFTIQNSESRIQNSVVEIFNVLGEKVYSQQFNIQYSTFNIGSQPSGIYLYKIADETGNLLSEGKFIIEK